MKISQKVSLKLSFEGMLMYILFVWNGFVIFTILLRDTVIVKIRANIYSINYKG